SRVEDMGIMEGCYEELGGYTVGFETFREDADAAPLMKGLPDDRCQSPHWGYVVRGKVTFSYPDNAETYEAGDAYYAPPGHTPAGAPQPGARAPPPAPPTTPSGSAPPDRSPRCEAGTACPSPRMFRTGPSTRPSSTGTVRPSRERC